MEFGTAGYTMDHVFVLYDRGSNSVWYPSETALEAVGGARKGAAVPFLQEPAPVPLGEWLEAHPGSTILLPTEHDYRMLNRPTLGVGVEDTDAGVKVRGVMEGSPAAEAGLLAGDLLRSFGGHAVAERRDLRTILGELSAGDTVELVVVREGKELTLKTTLRKR